MCRRSLPPSGFGRIEHTVLSILLGLATSSCGGGDALGPFLEEGRASTISLGSSHSCALNESGMAFCWGANSSGQLGNGTTTSSSAMPTAVVGGHEFQQLAAGSLSTCGLGVSGAAYCWGSNNTGQLGDGTLSGSSTPVAVAGGHIFVQLTVGENHACGIAIDGPTWCWGSNHFGQLGDGSSTVNTANFPGGKPHPVRVSGDRSFATISAGGYHTCALDYWGRAFCWGSNDKGQLGSEFSGTQGDHRSTPVRAGLFNMFVRISVGSSHSCALDHRGAAWCWGSNYQGEAAPPSTRRPRCPSGTAAIPGT